MKYQFFTCLVFNFVYLLLQACTEPQDLITPEHFTRVPKVQNLQGVSLLTPSGKRAVVLTWEYDTTNSNIRSWDVTRSINDTAATAYVPLEIVRKPAVGFPAYTDSSGSLQNFLPESLNVYYKIIPNGILNNFVGQPSDVLHMILRK
jgi:hypothetical protein